MKAILHSLGLDVSDKWMAVLLPASHILLILLLSWLLMRVSGKLIRLFKNYVTRTASDAGSIKRAETLGQVFGHVSVVTITLITGMLILGEIGISIAPILAAAGVVGLAVGFGAQSLIKDYFTGFFLLIEDQSRHGEVVEISGKKGKVEEVTLRHVRLRDFEGSVHFIPNSSITTVTNKSRDYAYSVIDLSVAYRENLDEVFDVIRQVGADMRVAPETQKLIIDDLDLSGISELADSAIIIRCRFKVEPLEQWDVKNEAKS